MMTTLLGKVKIAQLCLTLCNPMDYLFSPWNSLGENTGAGCCSPPISHFAVFDISSHTVSKIQKLNRIYLME